jgi:hypothetical protein
MNQSGLQGSQYRCITIWKRTILKKMFPSWSLSQKISGKSQKDVSRGTFSTNIQKLIFIFYSLIKITQGITHLESDPDFIAAAHIDNFLEDHRGIQCLNIAHIQRLALKIGQPLPQLPLPLSNKFVAAILVEHLYYAKQYADIVEQDMIRLEFAAQTRMYTFRKQTMMKIFGRPTMTIIAVIAIGQKFGLKAIILVVFLIWAAQPTQMAPISTICITLCYTSDSGKLTIGYNQASVPSNTQKWKLR